MLYTKKGDLGDTGTFGCDQRISKSSVVTEALGSLDEINSFLGVCKVKAKKLSKDVSLKNKTYDNILFDVQQKLFIIQAQVAGLDKKIKKEDVLEIEDIIDVAEKQMPKIKSFFVSGGSELSVSLDYARTISRRAERRVVAVSKEGNVKIDNNTLSYLNRLSSLLYAMVRYNNHVLGVDEEKPTY